MRLTCSLIMPSLLSLKYADFVLIDLKIPEVIHGLFSRLADTYFHFKGKHLTYKAFIASMKLDV